jgi:two-component system NarL family sensor kinase
MASTSNPPRRRRRSPGVPGRLIGGGLAGNDDSVARDVALFALAGLLAFTLVGAAGWVILGRYATDQAVRDARGVTRAIGLGVIEPELRPGLLQRDPAAIARLDRIVHRRVLRSPVVRVKVWSADGRIVYSDEPRLIGFQSPLEEDELTALRTHTTKAAVADLDAPENRFDHSFGSLLEVYQPVTMPGGETLLFESYQRLDAVRTARGHMLRAFAPFVVLMLLVLWLLQLPLAVRLARRIRRGREEREHLLTCAIEASLSERRRIAGDLHDGVVQELTGISFALDGAAESEANRGEDELTAVARHSARELRRSVRSLRSLVVDIAPPNLRTEGLEQALGDLLEGVQKRGIETHLEVPRELELSPDTEALVFRGAQEAIRNVLEHADATTVSVRVEESPEGFALVVEDDGQGLTPATVARRQAAGHVGLQLLGDLTDQVGGNLEVVTGESGGTRFTLEVPTQ